MNSSHSGVTVSGRDRNGDSQSSTPLSGSSSRGSAPTRTAPATLGSGSRQTPSVSLVDELHTRPTDRASPAAAATCTGTTPPTGSCASLETLAGIRGTAEYRAAWDVELWKAIQADRFRRQLEKQKRKAMSDLARVVKQREAMALSNLSQRTKQLDERERRVASEETLLETRKKRVQEMEQDLRGMRNQLLEAQRRVEEEVRAQVRRANEDIAHKARLLQERVRTAEEQAKRAEERQRQTESEYLTLYEEFGRFRTHQLVSLPAAPREGGSVSASSEEAKILHLRNECAEEQRLALRRQEQIYQIQLADSQQRCHQLEDQCRRLTAALARRREQLRCAASRVDTREIPAPAPAESRLEPMGATDATTCNNIVDASPRIVQLMTELQRLRHERVLLIEGSAGALSVGDSVVMRLDERIAELLDQISSRKSCERVTGDASVDY